MLIIILLLVIISSRLPHFYLQEYIMRLLRLMYIIQKTTLNLSLDYKQTISHNFFENPTLV